MDTELFVRHTFDAFIATVLCAVRFYGVFSILPLFSGNTLAQAVRAAICVALGLVAMPIIGPVSIQEHGIENIVLIILKEALIGFILGYIFSIPFWIFEAMGFFVDNQRGASIGAVLDPLSGNESAITGQLMTQTFIILFCFSKGFLLILMLIYKTFLSWNVLSFFPVLNWNTVLIMINAYVSVMYQMAVFAAPPIISMFMIELGLALASRSAPQLQVFILAMPLKGAIAFFVIAAYVPELSRHMVVQLKSLEMVVASLVTVFR